MFTGIITHQGTVAKKTDTGVSIRNAELAARVKPGDSVAVNGICLTATDVAGDDFGFTFMPETAAKTTIGSWREGNPVNLELPLSASGSFAGHIVQGHIDGVGTVCAIEADGNSRRFTIEVPSLLAKYIVAKGSVAVDGVSLTVIDAGADSFSVGIIPYTLEHTTFGTAQVGDQMNIETDILARYAERLTHFPS